MYIFLKPALQVRCISETINGLPSNSRFYIWFEALMATVKSAISPEVDILRLRFYLSLSLSLRHQGLM
jgi:hypothetical protein